MVSWLDELIATIANHARVIGAKGIEVEGRPGGSVHSARRAGNNAPLSWLGSLAVSSKKTTTSSNTPWAPAQGAITDSLGALTAANTTGQANLASAMPTVNKAIAQIGQNIDTPPAYLTDARTQLDKTINGDFIGQNPETSHIADLIAQKTGAQYNSTFGASGRAHGGMAALLSGQGVGDALSSFYGDQYNNERGLQQQAIGMAPQFHKTNTLT